MHLPLRLSRFLSQARLQQGSLPKQKRKELNQTNKINLTLKSKGVSPNITTILDIGGGQKWNKTAHAHKELAEVGQHARGTTTEAKRRSNNVCPTITRTRVTLTCLRIGKQLP
jgi:hypothetical protein